MVDLSIEFAGVTFKNPVVASSGIITDDIYPARKCVEAGAGAVITKSLCYLPSSWLVSRPSIWFYDQQGLPGSSANTHLGFLSPERGTKLIQELRPITRKANAVLIGNMNITGPYDEEKTQDLARKIEEAGAEMIEVSMGCVILLYVEYGGDWSKLADEKTVLRAVKEAVSIPVIMKRSADVALAHLDAIEGAGADAHSVAPTSERATVIDIETGRPVSPNAVTHGHSIRAIACYQLSKLAQKTRLPIMGGGGISTSRDVIEHLMCGAKLAGVQTAVMHRGPRCLTQMVDGLERFLERKGYAGAQDIVGIAVPHIDRTDEFLEFINSTSVSRENIREGVTITVDQAKCSNCVMCQGACPYGAISRDLGFASIDQEKCQYCGICQSLCPPRAIEIRLTPKPIAT